MLRQKGLSLYKFQQRFATEEQCRDYLKRKRWPNGFRCPKCGSNKSYRLSNGLFQCDACRHQTSVAAGTVMHRSHLPLTKWFLAMYFMAQDKRRISAVRLSQVIGVTYKAAWYLLTRLRRAMGQRDGTHTLNGTIELDDAFFGGPTKGKKRGRGTEKAKVFVALSLTAEGHPQYSKKYLAEHEDDIIIHKAAKKAFDEAGSKKLPTVKRLNAEYAELLAQKKATYAEYAEAKKEMRELLVHKANVEYILGLEEQEKTRIRAREREVKKRRNGAQPQMAICEKGVWGRKPPTSKTGDFRSDGNFPFLVSVATDAQLANSKNAS